MNANKSQNAGTGRRSRSTMRIDWKRLKEAGAQVLDITEIALKAGVDRRSIKKSQADEPLTPSKASAIVLALGVENPMSYTFYEYEGKSEAELQIGSSLKGWEVTDFFYGDAVRDIPFKVGKVYDKASDRYGRCKVFDLDSLDQETLEIIQFELARNSNICHRVRRNYAFPLAYENSFAATHKYWVVESWEDAIPLKQLVANSEIEFEAVPRIARDLAEALLALNSAGVIVRCLTPKMICLRGDDSLLVRDFELSTFVELTNSREIGEYKNAFYAPEFEDPHIDHRADLYSWAQVVIYCLTGEQPPSKQDAAFFASLPIPKKIANILQACTEHNPNFRKWGRTFEKGTFDFEDILAGIESWGHQ